jgi:type II secretory pathway pseudopilin PulG
MPRIIRLQNISTAKLHHGRRQRGYLLITLMLALALVTLALLAVLPEIGQQIQRDREEELRHRGSAYMRAIKRFHDRFSRYPSSLEELENTNNIRYLRKRYTDPMSRDPVTGNEKDFKLIHQADITSNNGPVLPGQNGPVGQGGLPEQGGSGGVTPGAVGAGGQTSANGNSGSPDASGNSNSPGSASSNSDTGSNSGLGFNVGPTFGGGGILGVASTSKAKTIRVFFGKTTTTTGSSFIIKRGSISQACSWGR